MNYCPHCGTNYVCSATHVCTTNTSAQLAGLRAEVTKLREELAGARRFIKRIAGQPTTEKVRSEAIGNGEATGLEDDEQLGDYPAAYDGMILDARAFLARKEAK